MPVVLLQKFLPPPRLFNNFHCKYAYTVSAMLAYKKTPSLIICGGVFYCRLFISRPFRAAEKLHFIPGVTTPGYSYCGLSGLCFIIILTTGFHPVLFIWRPFGAKEVFARNVRTI